MAPVSKRGRKREKDGDSDVVPGHTAIGSPVKSCIPRDSSVSSIHRKPRSKRFRKLSVILFVLVMAIIFGRHPSRGPLLADLVSPAERFLDEVDRWGNFSTTASIRSAIQDLFPANMRAAADEAPFYADIIQLSKESSSARRPVFFIPGYVTSGLELWESLPCAGAKFRERIWGTTSMIKLFLTHTRCWVSHMLLIPQYGAEVDGARPVHFADPDGVRIKPASGLAAADFVIGDYWVWNPIFEALGKAGYDESLMWMMSYDWRLAMRDLEHKERYFSRMVLEVEKLVKLNGQKVVIVAHSYGCKVWFFFLQWVAEHLSPAWMDEHVFTSYNIGPVLLGVPKAIGATLSGDTRDTAQMGALSTLLDTILPQTDRTALTAAWASITDMLPFGGRDIWPHPMLVLNGNHSEPLYVDEALQLLFNTTAMTHHAHHRAGNKTAMRCPTPGAPTRTCYRDSWVDPLSAPLPPLKNSSVWCVYGVGIPTEVGYHYTASSDVTDNGGFSIDKNFHDQASVVNGVILSDGDGTVPIQSLGHMCVNAWQSVGGKAAAMNPGNMTVHTREISHGQDYSVLARSASVGGSSVDHVDIMGNRQVIRDLLYLALGLEGFMDPPTQDPVAARPPAHQP